MTKTEILNKTKGIVKNYCELYNITVDDIYEHTHLQNDLGLDSLEITELETDLESEFDVVLILRSTDTINDVVFQIETQLALKK